jgi:transcriptional regulator with XRE-family HTH domain
MKKTYKYFGEAVDELRVEAGLSYDRFSLAVRIANSYLYNIINRRHKSAPKNEVIEKIATFFHLEPEYFFEYRLRKHLEILDKNPELLDKIDEFLKKLKYDTNEK